MSASLIEGPPCPSDRPVPIVARPSPRDLRAASALAVCCVPGSGATRGATRARTRRPRRGRHVPARRSHRHAWRDRRRNPGNDPGVRRGTAPAVGTGDRGRPNGRRGVHVRRHPAGPTPRRIRRGPGHRRPLHARREVLGEGGMGTVWVAKQTEPVKRQGRGQAHQGGMDSQGGAGPVRGRAAGAGPDGPPEHRQGARRRHDRRRPAVLRHGTGQGRADHRSICDHARLRVRGSGSNCSSPSARRSSTPTRRGSSTATSSRRTCWSPTVRRPAGAQGDRLRRGQGDRGRR